MIVVQGESVLQSVVGGGGTFTMELNNDDVDIVRDTRITSIDLAVDGENTRTRFDASDQAAPMRIVLQGKISGATNASVVSAVVRGKSYTINPPSGDVVGLPKKEYLEEMVAFGDAQVDPIMGVSSWNSGLMGPLTCFAQPEEYEFDGVEFVGLTQTGEDVTFTFYGTEIVNLFAQHGDYSIVEGIDITVKASLTDTGEVAEAEFTYENEAGGGVVSGVHGLDSSSLDFVTFDSGIHMASGWLDGMEISYQKRSLICSHGNMYYPMFKYLFFSAVAPMYFNKSLEPIALCAKHSGGLYYMEWVFTNNAAFGSSPAAVSVEVMGPDVSGAATVYADESTIIFDTSGVITLSGRVLLSLTIDGTQFGVSIFEAPCGIGTGEFITSGVDCKIAYTTLSNIENRGRTHEASSASLLSFHHMINGFENMLGWFDFYSAIMGMVFSIVTRGISCVLSSNTLQFVYYLIYENEKIILGNAERDIMIAGITSVLDRHNANLGAASTNVPKALRKEMSQQYLKTIHSDTFMEKRAADRYGVFIWTIFCVPITFRFPRRLPWMPTPPDVGVPLEANILENAEKEDGEITDDHIAMMKKNLGPQIFETRVDWILEPMVTISVKRSATTWFQMGRTVVLKRDGRHQELYAVNDDGYMLGDWDSNSHPMSEVSIKGKIGDKWNAWKREVINNLSRFTHINKVRGLTGTAAEVFVEDINSSISTVSRWTEYGVIDIDNSTYTTKGDTEDIKILRPNKDVIIALKK